MADPSRLIARKVWTRRLIKALRERMRLTQEEFARALGVTCVSVNRWERGHAKPKGLSIKALEEMSSHHG